MSAETLRNEALEKSIEITWRDKSFTIAPPDEWLLDFSHFAERGLVTQAIEVMLGFKQYEEFRTSKPKPKVSDVHALINQATTEFGIDTGEAAASTD